ncbi:hypothetical protein [Pandoraea pulmonicola]|uniref:Uncharacterized protein n=1 Tax=Pandoraea pulmonicola TaxID=93221 RepID=A0AAJ4ZDH3_PANPU|nr:hypothetical protein [Pandoraea pulmonicola]AJC20378.1 hypothetical protein RO07_07665 [Pandoraea pulmonicola]SUA91241.1 Uncharacterised protein [Pandoraea pulmonicola]
MRKRQSGIFLVSAAIAVAVVGMLITFWGVNYSRQMRTEKAERVGEALKAIGDAVDTFAVRYHADIQRVFEEPNRKFSVNGVEFKLTSAGNAFDEDHLSNLSAENLIKALRLPGVSSRPPSGVGEYAIRIYRTCGGTPKICQLRTLTFLTEPMKRTYSSEADFDFAAVAARKIGAAGGISTQDRPQNFRFIDEKDNPIPVKNPLNLAGLIAIRGGAQTDNLNLNVKRDGSLPMTGDLTMSGKDARGNSVEHSIVGVKNISGSGVLAMDELKIKKEATISGKLNLEKELDLRKNNIVGAGDIRGSGKLVMNSLTVNDADVGGKFTAKKGARFEGDLNMSGNEIKGAKKLEAENVTASGNLKSGEGLVELGKGVKLGDECSIWGLARDNDGRVVSCQREKERSNVWRWKLSSAPQTVKEVPVAIREEIERLVRLGEGWKMSVLSVDGRLSRGVVDPGNLYFRTNAGTSKVMACALLPPQAGLRTSRTPIMSLGDIGYVVGTGADELICLSKGRGSVRLDAYAWTWGNAGVPGSLTDRYGYLLWGEDLADRRFPIAVYDDKHREFKRKLEDLLSNLAPQAKPGDWSSQANVVGKRWFYRSDGRVVIHRALSCIVSDSGNYRGITTLGFDSRTRSPTIRISGGSGGGAELTCAFSDAGDLTAVKFKQCHNNCFPS